MKKKKQGKMALVEFHFTKPRVFVRWLNMSLNKLSYEVHLAMRAITRLYV